MEYINRFRNKMNRAGGNQRKENIFNSKSYMAETFMDDASIAEGIYFWNWNDTDYDSKETVNIRFYKRSFSNANGYTVKFQTEYDTPIIVGDVLYDSKNDEYYICTESFDIDSIHYQGKITLCNWHLRWQNAEGVILDYPCVDMNATQYNSGETASRQFVIGTSQHLVILPSDENTIIINTPKRFMLDKNLTNPTCFVVTQNDNTSYAIGKKGLVRLTLFEYPLDVERDRLDLGICDYIDVDKVESEDETISDKGVVRSTIDYESDVIKSGGDSQVYIGKFLNSSNEEILGVSPKWTLICDFISELTIVETDNKIEIGIDNEDYLDEEFKLVFSDENSNYSSSLIIKIDSLL